MADGAVGSLAGPDPHALYVSKPGWSGDVITTGTLKVRSMNAQEQQLLEDFLNRLDAVRGVAKDPQADALINSRLSGHPDALYLLVQRSLLQQAALQQAKAQIAQLQAQVQRGGQGDASFLGGSSWGTGQSATPPPIPNSAPSWRERLFGGAPRAAAQGSGQPSFLASAATTAAGVAGGMFLFDGIEDLLGGRHGGGMFGNGGEEPVVENVTNNFYDDGSQDAGQDFAQGDSFNDDLGSFDDDGSWS